MEQLTESEIKILSFPDYPVERMLVTKENKKLIVAVEGAYLDGCRGKELEKVTLEFTQWDSLLVSLYSGSEWLSIENEEIGILKDICEFEVTENYYFLRGFSRSSGKWVEWKIKGASLLARYKSL